MKNINENKNTTIDIEKIKKEKDDINKTKEKDNNIDNNKIENKEQNKDNNIDNNIKEENYLNTNNKINKDNEINFEDINKIYYKEENSFLDFDNFSEINKSSTSLKNTDKKEKNKELQTQEENNKKEIPDKILNKSPQKNQENYDDICNIRYLDEELNTNKKKENENDNNISKNKESEKLSQSEINRRLNFFDESATLPRKEKKGNINKEDEDDLVQEKPDDYSNDDNINIKDESDIKENINNEEEQKGMNNNIEKELQQNMKESETLKDSYCDKLLKNMDEYRKMVNSNES